MYKCVKQQKSRRFTRTEEPQGISNVVCLCPWPHQGMGVIRFGVLSIFFHINHLNLLLVSLLSFSWFYFNMISLSTLAIKCTTHVLPVTSLPWNIRTHTQEMHQHEVNMAPGHLRTTSVGGGCGLQMREYSTGHRKGRNKRKRDGWRES